MAIKLVIIEDTSTIMTIWHQLVTGIRESLKHTDGDITEESVYNDLVGGRMFTQIVLKDDKYAGFVTGRIEGVQGGKTYLTIFITYLKNGNNESSMFEVIDELKKFGTERGCSSMRFHTVRGDAFGRKLRDTGWRQTYTEFVTDLGGEDG